MRGGSVVVMVRLVVDEVVPVIRSPRHVTPASSSWRQSVTPQPSCRQAAMEGSSPEHVTESSHTGPAPAPKGVGLE